MPLIDTRVPLIAVSCLAQSWSVVSTPATAETHRTIAIAPVQIDASGSHRTRSRTPVSTANLATSTSGVRAFGVYAAVGSGGCRTRLGANLGESFVVGRHRPRSRLR